MDLALQKPYWPRLSYLGWCWLRERQLTKAGGGQQILVLNNPSSFNASQHELTQSWYRQNGVMTIKWWRPRVSRWGGSLWPRKPQWSWRNSGSNPQSFRWPSWVMSTSARWSGWKSSLRWWAVAKELGSVVMKQVSESRQVDGCPELGWLGRSLRTDRDNQETWARPHR